MKIFLGSAVYSTHETGNVASLMRFGAAAAKRNVEWHWGVVGADAAVDRARSRAATKFLDSDCDVLMTIDSDITFPPEAVIDLCEKAMKHKIVGGLYMTRTLGTQPAMLLPADEPVAFDGGAPLTEVPFVSTGFMAVHREVFETLTKTLPLCHQDWDIGRFWPFYMPFTIPWPGDVNLYLSEDWAFCQRAKDAGYKIWLDPSFRLGHDGKYKYTLEDLAMPEKLPNTAVVLTRNGSGKLDQSWSIPAEASISQGTKK